ncbi:Arf17p [Castilleja foliolosa]|uniref:Auxin response factor n=1 Tax=Castilleja foliolosa TaxID=1961234 RepID=A0ABD3DK85_9LAMI
MASSSSTAPRIDAAIWHTIVGAAVKIPPPNSDVYYFPQGHLEQYDNPAAAQNYNIALDHPVIPCRVVSVGLFYQPQSEQPFAKILLQPAINPWRQQQRNNQNDDPKNDIVSYWKVLTPSDANNGGGFSVPRACADSIFPRLDFTVDRPAQSLIAKDPVGNAWEFRHIYRGTPRRHLLTTGWSKYVNAKLLVAGDTVIFMRKNTSDRRDELFVGFRRSGKYGGNNGGGADASEVMEEIKKAVKGMAFEVVYYPRVGLPDFVVRVERVEESSEIQWGEGMRVRMDRETEDSTRMGFVVGTIKSVLRAASGPWQASPWRMLQVAWDEPNLVLNMDRVSPWEVEHVPCEPHPLPKLPPAKKLKASSPDRRQQGIQIRDQSENQTLSFTQLLTRIIESNGDDIDDDDYVGQLERSNVGGSSFRLFGQDIETGENGHQAGSSSRK